MVANLERLLDARQASSTDQAISLRGLETKRVRRRTLRITAGAGNQEAINRRHLEQEDPSSSFAALWPGDGSDHYSPRDRHVSVPASRVATAFKGILGVSEMPDWKG